MSRHHVGRHLAHGASHLRADAVHYARVDHVAARAPFPDWSRAWVPEGKLDYYLGLVGNEKSADRAAVFVGILGFHDAVLLRTALIAHVQTQPVAVHKVSLHGVAYNAVGPLVGPNGRCFERMATGWIITPESSAPRNVSAFPDRKRTR